VKIDKDGNVVFNDGGKKAASPGDLLIAMFKNQDETKAIKAKQRSRGGSPKSSSGSEASSLDEGQMSP
jgi:hypothetical protein